MRGLVDRGVEQGASLVVDGRGFGMQGYENGFFIGGCLFDHVQPEMDIYKTEIFGPVLSVVRASDYEDALALAMDNEFGNGAAIFTRDGDTARDFASRINIGMVGVNVPIPVPLAYYTRLGGWKASMFGDLNQHGPDSFRFWTPHQDSDLPLANGDSRRRGFQHPGPALISGVDAKFRVHALARARNAAAMVSGSR